MKLDREKMILCHGIDERLLIQLYYCIIVSVS